jgi:hypothetical protein
LTNKKKVGQSEHSLDGKSIDHGKKKKKNMATSLDSGYDGSENEDLDKLYGKRELIAQVFHSE